MSITDPATILALLKDPNIDSQQLAEATGAPREEAARAARLVMGIAKIKPEDPFSLSGLLAAAVAHAAFLNGRVDLLAALAIHPSREAAKEAKRGLHVLKARGVLVPEPPRPAPPLVPVPAPEPSFPCYASAMDWEGERAVWVSRVVPGRGIEMGQVVLSDTLGILELQIALLGRKECRAFGQEIEEKGRAMGVAEIPRERAKSLIAAVRHLNEVSGHLAPEGTDTWLARLGPAAPLEDPALGFPPLPEEEERHALLASGQLHEQPMMRDWIAEEAFLRELEPKLSEIEVSPLYLDDRQRAEQVAWTIDSAVDNYLDEPRRRRRLAGRLFETAAQLIALGDSASAQIAAATARAVAAGLPSSQIPFARMLVEKSFSPVARTFSPNKSEGEKSLIVLP